MCVIDPDTSRSRGYFTLSSFKYYDHQSLPMANNGVEKLAMSCPPTVRSWTSVSPKRRVDLPPNQMSVTVQGISPEVPPPSSDAHPRKGSAAS